MRFFHSFFAVVALSGILVLPGCKVQPAPPADGVSRFPTGEPLEAGDILVARSYGLIGALFANHSPSPDKSKGRYSHGSMVYRADDGHLMVLNYRPTGMETCTPEEYFSRYNRLGLVRYAGNIDAARFAPETGIAPTLTGSEALSASARFWLAKNREKRIPPDYRLDHDDHGAMFCLELPSTVYRECGLPDPFHWAVKADSDPLLNKGNRLFNAEVIELRSPSSVLFNPDFYTVSEWLRPEYDLRREALNEALVQEVVDDVSAGLLPRRPSLAGRMKLAQIFAVYRLLTGVLFWRPKQDLPDFIDKQVIYNAYTLYCYIKSAKKVAWTRIESDTAPVHDGGDLETLKRVRQIVAESCNIFRGRYMCAPEESHIPAEPEPRSLPSMH